MSAASFIGADSTPGPMIAASEGGGGPDPTEHLLFTADISAEYRDLRAAYEALLPGQVTYGPSPILDIQGVGPDPTGGAPLGSFSISYSAPDVLSVDILQCTSVRIDDVFISGVDQGDLGYFTLNAILGTPTGYLASVSRYEVLLAGPEADYDPADVGDGANTFTYFVAGDHLAPRVPLTAQLKVYGFVLDAGVSPEPPIIAPRGPKSTAHSLTAWLTGYIDKDSAYRGAFTRVEHLGKQYQGVWQTPSSFVGVVSSMMFLDIDGNLLYDACGQNTGLQLISKDVAAFEFAYAGVASDASIFVNYDTYAYLALLKDGTVGYWSSKGNGSGTELDLIPPELKNPDTAHVIMIRGPMVSYVDIRPTLNMALFGALTEYGDLYLWGKAVTGDGWPDMPINIPGAVDFVIDRACNFVYVLTQDGDILKIDPTTTTRVNQRIYQIAFMGEGQIDDGFMVKLADGRLSRFPEGNPSPGAPDYAILDADEAFLAGGAILPTGDFTLFYPDYPGTFSTTKTRRVKAPSGVTMSYPDDPDYDGDTSPVPSKFRRLVWNNAVITAKGQMMEHSNQIPLDRRLWVRGTWSNSVVSWSFSNTSTRAALDCYGDAYVVGNASNTEPAIKTLAFAEKVKAMASWSTTGSSNSSGGNHLVGINMSNRLIRQISPDITLPSIITTVDIKWIQSIPGAGLCNCQIITANDDVMFTDRSRTAFVYNAPGAIEAISGYFPAIDDDRNPTGSSNYTSIVRYNDGSVREKQFTGLPFSNVLVGQDPFDIGKFFFGQIGNGRIVIQLKSDPKKFRMCQPSIPSVGGAYQLSQWTDITLPVKPVDWFSTRNDGIVGDNVSLNLFYARVDGSLWKHTSTWRIVAGNYVGPVLTDEQVLPPGTLRVDLFTAGLPPPEGGWGLDWGNFFGG